MRPSSRGRTRNGSPSPEPLRRSGAPPYAASGAQAAPMMEIGVYTFGDLFPDPVTGETRTPRQKLRETVKLAKLAEEVGLDVFAVGEHHRLDMAISSPPVVL